MKENDPMAVIRFRIIVCLLSLLIAVPAALDHAWAETRITYRLKWIRNMSTVGEIYAVVHGVFRRHGLDVMVKPGGPEIDAIRELELGQADFGVASADQVIRAAAKGSPVIVIAQLFQANPLQWIYRPDRSNGLQPRDLIGKTLGVTFGKNDEIIMRTLLAKARIREDQVRLFSVRLDYTPFFEGRVDLWPVYINTQGVELGRRLMASGGKIAFFDPNAHGIQFVANSVVTTRDKYKQHPDVVRRFVRALLDGWRQALDPVNAEKAIGAVKKFDRDTRLEVLSEQLIRTRKLVLTDDSSVLGAIDPDAWRQTETMMRTHKQIARPVDIDSRLIVLDR
jgi:NitT/TauT family transport system substrate-binding protein